MINILQRKTKEYIIWLPKGTQAPITASPIANGFIGNQGHFIILSTVRNIATEKSKFDEINLAITGRIKRSSEGCSLDK